LVRQQHFQRRFAVNVWVGVIDGYVIGQFLGFSRVLLSGANLNFLQNELPILLEDVPLNLRHQMIFQHDGAPPHFSVEVRKYLDETFPVWIGRGGTVPWPVRSPDLTPLNFFVWGFYQTRV